MEKINLTNKCGYWNISRLETKNAKENSITELRYQDMGCDSCLGYETSCQYYFSPLIEYEKGLKTGFINKAKLEVKNEYQNKRNNKARSRRINNEIPL